jgi:glutathione S-transferase
MLRLYDYWESGNAYKVRLLLHQLDLPFERVHLDILKGETRQPAFLEKNSNHRVPTLEWPDGRCLAESNAILSFLSEATELGASDAWERAQMLQWMFFEQYSHEPNIAVVRFWHFSGQLDEHRDALSAKMEAGYHALGVMEEHLRANKFFVGGRYSIADIALYAYTHVADEGGFALADYPAVADWLVRVASQKRFVSISESVGTLVEWPPAGE